MFKTFETELAGRKLVIENGKIAELASVPAAAQADFKERVAFFPVWAINFFSAVESDFLCLIVKVHFSPPFLQA